MKQLSRWQLTGQRGWSRSWGGQSPASCPHMDSHPEAPAQPFSLNKRNDVILVLAAELEGGDRRYRAREERPAGAGGGEARGQMKDRYHTPLGTHVCMCMSVRVS